MASRIQSQVVPNGIDFQRHPSLFFLDGDVTITADDDGRPSVYGFRVHRRVLVQNSPVFQALLESANDCTIKPGIVKIHDDMILIRTVETQQNLELLLQAMYDPAKMPLRSFCPHAASNVQSLLLVALKYRSASISTRILSHVQQDFPTNLEKWDRREDAIRAMRLDYPKNKDGTTRLDDFLPEPASIVALVRQAKVPEARCLLPAAFYDLTRIHASHDFTAARNPSTYPLFPSKSERTARWKLLEGDELLAILRGRDVLEKYVREINQELFVPQHSSAEEQHKCHHGVQVARGFLVSQAFHKRDLLRALRDMAAHNGAVIKQLGVCSHCTQQVVGRVHEMRRQVWRLLPKAFGLVGVAFV